MGYSWNVFFRLSPGGTRNLKSLMPWAGGPVEVRFNNEPDVVREDIAVDGTKRVVFRGLRQRFELKFAIGANMGDHSTFAEIVNALLSETTTVEISLNGGTTYRFVEMVERKGPEPFEGKTVSGARYTLVLESTTPVSSETAIGTGNF